MTTAWRLWLAPSPAAFILLTLIVTLGLQGLSVYALMQQPWTGIQTRPDIASGHVRITGITPGSPAARQTGLQAGQQLVSLTTTSQTLALTATGRDEYLSAADYATLDQRRAEQTGLWNALTQAAPITLLTQTGESTTLTPQRYTPLAGIPAYIWFLLPLHVLLPLVGSLVWLYKPHTLESSFLYLAGISYSVFGAAFCVLYQREFTLNPEWILPLTSLGNGSMFLLGMALCTILTYYPQRVLGLQALLVFGGSLVIATDILLVGLLNLSGAYALGMAIVIAGFVYFPLRQWVLGR